MTQLQICFLRNRRNTLMWVKSTNENRMTSCCLSHKKTCLVLVKKAGWEGLSSFNKSGYGFLLPPTTYSAVCLAGRGSGIQEGSQRGWLIPKALSCQEDLYSADRGNVFCQAFEIQMMPSTLCPTDGFESSHKRGATETGPTRAEGERKRQNQLHPKNRWQCQNRGDANRSSKSYLTKARLRFWNV